MIRFRFPGSPDDYLGRLSRLRWRRAFEAADELCGSLEVPDARALPAPGSAEAVAAAAVRHPDGTLYPFDSAPGGELSWEPPPVSTLRELEESAVPGPSEARPLGEPPEDFPARFVPDRGGREAFAVPGFRVLRVRETFGPREEILVRIPRGARRLIDVGCGAGETAAEARRRNPGLRVEGVERDARFRAAAGAVLDAFHPGDALEVLREIGSRGDRFDVLIFADSLEHFSDPFVVLEAARAAASPGAVLIVSVPNAASAPIVGDLLRGRFDPIGAGPEDAGHLRWFTRRSLEELIVESGFSLFACDSVPVPEDGGLAATLRAAGVSCDPALLGAIQWIAAARNPG